MTEDAKYNWRSFSNVPALGAGFLHLKDIPQAALYRDTTTYNCVLVTEGRLFLQYGEERLVLQRGDVLQRWPNRSPDFRHADEGSLMYCITLSSTTYEALHEQGMLRDDLIFTIQMPEYLTRWMPKTAAALRTAPQDTLFEQYLAVQRLLIHLHRAARRDEPQRRAVLTEQACQRLCDQCLLPTPDIEGIAAELGMSYETFRKMFRAQVGMAPHHYLLEQRFIHARRLLREGLSVQQAAVAVGYTDPYTFSRQFKLQTGIPPAEYRKLHIKDR